MCINSTRLNLVLTNMLNSLLHSATRPVHSSPLASACMALLCQQNSHSQAHATAQGTSSPLHSPQPSSPPSSTSCGQPSLQTSWIGASPSSPSCSTNEARCPLSGAPFSAPLQPPLNHSCLHSHQQQRPTLQQSSGLSHSALFQQVSVVVPAMEHTPRTSSAN
jgi:hypothetical protein